MTLLDLSAPFLFRGRRRYYGSELTQPAGDVSVLAHWRPPVVKQELQVPSSNLCYSPAVIQAFLQSCSGFKAD